MNIFWKSALPIGTYESAINTKEINSIINPRITPINLVFPKAKNIVINMPKNIVIAAILLSFVVNDDNNFLKPIKNPNERNSIIFIIANRRANLRILKRAIAMIETVPAKKEKKPQTAAPIILSIQLRLKQSDPSDSFVSSINPPMNGILEF